MPFPIILAHGSLGYWDELIFLGIAVIFCVMMFISWFRSRNMDFEETDLMPNKPKNDDTQSGERFQLD